MSIIRLNKAIIGGINEDEVNKWKNKCWES